MPAHDWTRVDAGIFHSFHLAWIAELKKAFNGGLLPEGYYALAEQHAGQAIADVLTLHTGAPSSEARSRQPARGGTAIADAEPQVRMRQTIEPASYRHLRRTLTVRHVSGHRLVALLEILSPANKDRSEHVDIFIDKILDALEAGVHVLIADLFPPSASNPYGIHGAFQEHVGQCERIYEVPANEPMTLVSYAGGSSIEVYLEHVAAGARLPDMPLFLHADRYVNVPLETTYSSAYGDMPAYWREVLESPFSTPS